MIYFHLTAFINDRLNHVNVFGWGPNVNTRPMSHGASLKTTTTKLNDVK